jgi:type I restriction enzyme S subunit
VCSSDIYVLEPKGEDLLPELLPFICQTDAFFEHAVGTSAGSLSPRTNWDSLASFEFALPPIEEQRRMSEVLIVADQAIEALRELRIAASQLRRADLASFFTDRALHCKRLDQVASVLAGSTPNRSKSDYWGGTRLWASAKDLKVDELVSTEDRLTDAGWREATIAPTGATLIVVRGMILAHTFPVTRCLAPTAFNQDLRALVAKGDVSDRYLSLWAEWMVPWFLANTSESSHGTKRLTGEVIQAALVPCADPVAQQMFVDRQERLVGAERAIDARIARARETRSSALHQFFQG